MRYEAPKKLSADEIEGILSSDDVSPAERIKTVISAIYYGHTVEYSGDILITEFSSAKYDDKIWLVQEFETFHQMCGTNYRIDESINLLEQYKQEAPHHAPEIE